MVKCVCVYVALDGERAVVEKREREREIEESNEKDQKSVKRSVQ